MPETSEIESSEERGDDRAGERVAQLEPPSRHEPVEQQHDACGQEQRYAVTDSLLDEAAVETQPVERPLDPREQHLLREVQEHDSEHERCSCRRSG